MTIQLPGVTDLKSLFSEHDTDMDGVILGLLVKQVQLLERIAEPQTPVVLLAPQHDAVTVASGKTVAGLSFKNSKEANTTWLVWGYAYKSMGGNATTLEVYSDPSDYASGNYINLVDTNSSNPQKAAVSDRAQPVPVLPGHHLVFAFTGATAADELRVTMWGQRVDPTVRGGGNTRLRR